MSSKQQKAVFITAVCIFIAVCAGLCIAVGFPMVRMAGEPEVFRDWVNEHGVWGKFFYVGIVALQVVVALIPGEPLELAGGYAFGALEGTILALLGIVIGSAMVFELVRRYGVKLVEVFFSREKIESLAFMKNPKKTRVIAFLLMLIPGTPKDFLSYFAGLTKLRLMEWLVIVTVARIPSVISSTISGGAMGDQDYWLAAITMGVTVLLSAAGILYYRHICREQSEAK